MNTGNYVWVPAGVLESPIKGRVAAHIFTESKASWEEEAGNCSNYLSAPEDIHAFMKSLSNED